jgi:TRAP-type C4-dicarboxylate transport system permease small subunit
MTLGRDYALRRIIYGFSKVIYVICGAGCMLGLMFLIVTDVGLRYLFNRPIVSSYELIMFMMVIVVFSALSYTATEDGHVTVDLVVLRLPKGVQRFLKVLTSLLSVGLFALMAQQSIVRANALRLEGLISQILHIPVYPFYFFTAFGSALLSLVLLLNILDFLIPERKE